MPRTTKIQVRIECACERHEEYQGIEGTVLDDGLSAIFVVNPDQPDNQDYDHNVYVLRTCVTII